MLWGGVTSFTYDGDRNLSSVTDAEHGQNPTNYTYDNMDRLQTRTDPLSNPESYVYDGNGNLTQFTDRRGKVTTYGYDALNRLTFVGFGTQAGPTYESTINYSYDIGDRLTQAVDSVAGTYTRSYDGLDRLTQEQSPEGTVGYVYDADSRRTQMTVSNQSSPVNYSYDNASRLTAITQGSSNVLFSYDAANRRSSLTLPNGITVNYSYDSASQLTGISYQLAGASLGSLGYTYDSDGRRTQVAGNWARTGIANATTSTAVYNAANELTSWNGANLTYDTNGNMMTDGTSTYTWNARNQLASISGPTTGSFEYDPFGRRLERTINGVATDFLYDRANAVQELSGGIPTANRLTGGIDEFFNRTSAGGSVYPLEDALGNTIALTDSSGSLQTQYTYDPFGNTTESGPPDTNPYQYTGREYDDTGLYYYRARYFSSGYDRFISQDSARSASGGINLYAYVGNSPSNFRDPRGMIRIDPMFPASCLSALKRAIEIVRRAAQQNPKCNCQFNQMGQGRSLLQLLDSPNITVHYDVHQQPVPAYEGPGKLAGQTETGNTHDIWMEPFGCSMGRWTMASYLVHELTHIALTPDVGQEGTAMQAQVTCGFPIQVLSPTITVRP